MKKLYYIVLILCAFAPLREITAQKYTIPIKSVATYTSSEIDSLIDLEDVLITSPATNQVLLWNGTKWVNAAAPGGGGGTVLSVGATQPTEGLTITGGPITTSGTFIFTLNHDLAALEQISTTGIAVRTGPSTWATRNITGTGGIVISNNGITGDIVIDGSGISGGGGGATDLTWTGISSGSATLSSSTGTDVVITAGTNVSFSGTSGNLTITATAGGGGDPSITNEGSLTVGAGGSNSSTIVSNTSGSTAVTIASTNAGIAVTETGNTINLSLDANIDHNLTDFGSSVTWSSNISGLSSDQITINEGTGISLFATASALTITNTGDLSNSNETDNLTFTTSGANAILNIANSQGSGGTDVTFIAGSNISFGITGSSITINSTGSSGGSVSGSGSANFMTKWVASTTLGNSLMQDNGTNIGIGLSPTSSAGHILQLPQNSTLRIGTAGSGTQRVGFGDLDGGNVPYVYVGEEDADDRLVLKGSSMSFKNGGSSGLFGQVPTATGLGTWTWQAPASSSYTAGTGISISSNVISNTGDLSTTNEIQSLTASGGASPTLGITLGGTGVTFTGSGISFFASGTNIAMTAADASASNELQSFTTSGLVASLTGGVASSIALSAGSNVTISNIGSSSNPIFQINASTGSTYTAGTGISISSNIITNTGDLSATNEGLLTVGGSTNARTISSNTSGSNTVTFTNGGIVTVAGTGNTISISATEVDGSITNEAQTLSLASHTLTLTNVSGVGGGSVNLGQYSQTFGHAGSTSYTNTLSNAGGQFTLSAGSGIGISHNGSGNVTFTNTSPGITYTGGTGISVSGSVITNTGDASSSNELQTLSYNAQNNQLSLSNGGGTVSIFGTGTQTISSNATVDINSTYITINSDVDVTFPSVVNGKMFFVRCTASIGADLFGLQNISSMPGSASAMTVVGFSGNWVVVGKSW